MASSPSEAEILALFDRLVETGKIFYDYSFKTVCRRVDGLDVSEHLMKAEIQITDTRTVRVPHLRSS